MLKVSTKYTEISQSDKDFWIFISPNVFLVGNPFEVSTTTPEHVMGHIVWGLIPGLAFLSLRYIILAGLFPIILDADHLLQFLEIEMVPRMAHSLPFILVAIVVMMLLFGKKDIRLIAVSVAAVFSHMSFDTILGGSTEFPVLIPFTSQFFTFSGIDWIIFQVIAATIILTASVIVKKNYSRFLKLQLTLAIFKPSPSSYKTIT